MDLEKASRKLSQLDITTKTDNLVIDVLWFRRHTLKGNWIINRHMHSTYEFHFVSSGKCGVILDDDSFTIGTGEFYLTAPGVQHKQIGLGNDDFVEYSLNCDINYISKDISEEKYILKVLNEAQCKPVKDLHGAIKLFDQALKEAYHENIGYFNNIKSIVLMIVIAATRALVEEGAFKYDVSYKLGKDDYRFRRIEQFIKDNIGNKIFTKDIANFVHLGDRQVSRIIKEKLGITTKDYINKVKMEKAKELLRETNLPIWQIGEMLGFGSEYYFNQFFKRNEGLPPGKFRDNTLSILK